MVPHDYLAVCLEDVEQRGYLAHSLSGLDRVLVRAGPASPLEGASIRIRVTDSGIGIPARDLPHVFDKLYR